MTKVCRRTRTLASMRCSKAYVMVQTTWVLPTGSLRESDCLSMRLNVYKNGTSDYVLRLPNGRKISKNRSQGGGMLRMHSEIGTISSTELKVRSTIKLLRGFHKVRWPVLLIVRGHQSKMEYRRLKS